MKVSTSKNPFNTLFLDRDGVINVRDFDGYITRPSEFIFCKHAMEGIQLLASLFDRIIVVTNQQCIAKNIISKSNLNDIHRYMTDSLAAKGIKIDAIYVAENLKDAPNDRRKPSPAMGLEAKEQFSTIDFTNSWMVGDTDSDILFGMNLGMHTAAVKSNERLTQTPTLLVTDLVELYNRIKPIK